MGFHLRRLLDWEDVHSSQAERVDPNVHRHNRGRGCVEATGEHGLDDEPDPVRRQPRSHGGGNVGIHHNVRFQIDRSDPIGPIVPGQTDGGAT